MIFSFVFVLYLSRKHWRENFSFGREILENVSEFYHDNFSLALFAIFLNPKIVQPVFVGHTLPPHPFKNASVSTFLLYCRSSNVHVDCF